MSKFYIIPYKAHIVLLLFFSYDKLFIIINLKYGHLQNRLINCQNHLTGDLKDKRSSSEHIISFDL